MRGVSIAVAVLATLLGLASLPIGSAQPALRGTAAYLPAVFKDAASRAAPTVQPSATPPLQPTSTPVVQPTAVLPGSLFITSRSGSYASSTRYEAVGELLNTGGQAAYDAKVTATWYNANGDQVGGAQGEGLLIRIDPGARIPFLVQQFNAPPNIAAFGLFVEWRPSTTLDWRPVAVLSENVRDNFGVEVFGSLRNNQDIAVNNVRVAVTFYDAAGSVVAVDRAPQLYSLAPGEVRTYTASTLQTFEYTSYLVQAEGYTN